MEIQVYDVELSQFQRFKLKIEQKLRRLKRLIK